LIFEDRQEYIYRRRRHFPFYPLSCISSRNAGFEIYSAQELRKLSLEQECQERELTALASSGDVAAVSQLIKNTLENPANFAEGSKKTGPRKKRSSASSLDQFAIRSRRMTRKPNCGCAVPTSLWRIGSSPIAQTSC